MVTGIETAGLILATLPLVIATLEHYRAGMEPVLIYFRFDAEYRSFVKDVEKQLQLCRNHLEELLARLGAEPAALLSRPGGDEQKNARLEQQLRDFLGRLYGPYCDCVGDVQETLDALLNMEVPVTSERKDQPSSPVPPLNFALHVKRLRFALSKRKRDMLLGKLQRHNNMLETMFASSSRLAPARQKRQRPSLLVAALEQIRERASTVHSALAGSWKCACASPHAASLLLEKRGAPDDEPRRNGSDIAEHQPPPPPPPPTVDGRPELCFNILFRFVADSRHFELQGGPWAWHDVEVAVVAPQQASDVRQHVPNGVAKAASPDHAPIALTRAGRKKAIGALACGAINAAAIKKKSRLRFAEQGAVREDNIALPTTSLNELSCLCSAITAAQGGVPMKGLVRLDNRQSLEVFPVTPEKACASGQGFVSLDFLLDPPSSPFGLYKFLFSKRQRYHSALVLASSLLQLHATPWLDDAFDKTGIFFRIESPVNPSYSLIKVLGGPYVVRTFAPLRQGEPVGAGVSEGARSAVAQPDSRDLTKKCLLRLSIILLELVFGRTVEAHPAHRAVLSAPAAQREWADSCAAVVWSRDVAEEAGPGFHSAIASCVNGDFGGVRADLADRGFMAAFGDAVVQKLDDAVSRFWAPEPDDQQNPTFSLL